MMGVKGLPATYGGVEKHTEELSTRLAARKHKVAVYCRSHYSVDGHQYKGVTLIRIPTIRQKHVEMITHSLLSSLHFLISDNNVDIIHIQSIDPAIIAFISKIKTKVVVTSHGWAYKTHNWNKSILFFSRLAEKNFTIIPNCRIVVSKTLKKYYESIYPGEYNYIPNGVEIPDLNKYRSINFELPMKNNIKKSLHLYQDNYLLCVSRILPNKGLDILVEAWKNVKTDKQLLIVGGSSYEDNYRKFLEKNADERTYFVDYRYGRELKMLYANAYLTIMPSCVEGMSFTLLESMSFSKCVVYSNIPENREVVDNCGIPFIVNNSSDLSEKIKLALSDHQLCFQLGSRGLGKAKNEYSWDQVVEKTEKLYNSLYI